jgi:hypothetical protein
MITIVEIPHCKPVKAWQALDEQDAIDKIELSRQYSYVSAIENTNILEMLDLYRCESIDEMKESNPEVFKNIEIDDYSTMYYRTWDSDIYQVEKPDFFNTYLEFNAHDLSNQLVFMNDDEAKEALNNDSLWKFHQGIEARASLENILTYCNMSSKGV